MTRDEAAAIVQRCSDFHSPGWKSPEWAVDAVLEVANRGLTFAQLREVNALRQKEWDSDGRTDTLVYRAMELGGEAGEVLAEVLTRAVELGAKTGSVLNVAKKLERERLGVRGSRSTREALAEELADVVICANLLATLEGIDLGAAVTRKFNKTSDSVGLKTKLPE